MENQFCGETISSIRVYAVFGCWTLAVTSPFGHSGHEIQKEQKIADNMDALKKTLQDMQMLSTFTLNCQVTKIVTNSGSGVQEFANTQIYKI